MHLNKIAPLYRQAVEEELKQVVDLTHEEGLEGLYHMLAYHLGWEGEGAGDESSGKRIRPVLVLLTCESAGGDWQKALPAAAAVELVHNFSLIHDDIEDNSPLRRGRPTLWNRWGIAQAINAGDTMFTLAYLAIHRLEKTTNGTIALKAQRILHDTALHLTQGQYLDLLYEQIEDLSLQAYWPMVRGKTAALLSACSQLGALVADVPEEPQQNYGEFATALGLAFQVQDDLLGIWGDVALTGKSTESDLLSGKKSLPILYAIHQNGAFAQRWAQGPISPSEVPELANLLEQEGARSYTQKTANQLTQQSLDALERANPQGEAGEALVELAHKLLDRIV